MLNIAGKLLINVEFWVHISKILYTTEKFLNQIITRILLNKFWWEITTLPKLWVESKSASTQKRFYTFLSQNVIETVSTGKIVFEYHWTNFQHRRRWKCRAVLLNVYFFIAFAYPLLYSLLFSVALSIYIHKFIIRSSIIYLDVLLLRRNNKP